MPSLVSLLNRALRLAGGKAISAADEKSLEANLAYQAFADVRDGVLCDFAWGFATIWTSLPKLATTPAFGMNGAYKLPIDCVRIIDVRASSELAQAVDNFYLAGREVYTNASPCYMRYVARIENTELYPPHFCESLVLRLAAEIYPSLGTDSGQALKLRQLYLQSLETARLIDVGQANAVKENEQGQNAFLQARN